MLTTPCNYFLYVFMFACVCVYTRTCGVHARVSQIIRASFDVGSGATKVEVAVVSTQTSPARVIDVLFSEQTEVLYR